MFRVAYSGGVAGRAGGSSGSHSEVSDRPRNSMEDAEIVEFGLRTDL